MTTHTLRIGFAGTPDFAARHLQALLDDGRQILAVYSQPDRPAGRGKKLQPSAVKSLALKHDLLVYTPSDLKSETEVKLMQALQLDVLVVVAYGLILPQAILDIPRFGCINVHASLLPRWRGAAPIERAILAGDKESGVSLMQMDAGLDSGAVLWQASTPITAEDNSETLGSRLIVLGQKGLLEVLRQMEAGSLAPKAQDHDESTYAKKLDKTDALIHWHKSATEIQRLINAFYPRSPAWCFYQGERIKIIKSRPLSQSADALPGTIIKADRQGLLLACSEGCLLVEELQLPGKKPASVAALLNGQPRLFLPGSLFESQENSE
jgi:methionyl-tRNA formyltransferase